MTRGLITGSTTSTTAEIEVTAAGTTATAQVAIAAGDGGFVTPVKLPARIADGTLNVRVHIAGTPATDRETTRVDFTTAAGSPVLFRPPRSLGPQALYLLPFTFYLFSLSDLYFPVALPDLVARLIVG
jgi:hypothetical protein